MIVLIVSKISLAQRKTRQFGIYPRIFFFNENKDCSRFKEKEWINYIKILFFWTINKNVNGWMIHLLLTKLLFLIHNKMKLYANKITPRMIGKLYRLALFSKTNKRVCFIATWPLLPQIYCLRFITASNICCFYHNKMNWFL